MKSIDDVFKSAKNLGFLVAILLMASVAFLLLSFMPADSCKDGPQNLYNIVALVFLAVTFTAHVIGLVNFRDAVIEMVKNKKRDLVVAQADLKRERELFDDLKTEREHEKLLQERIDKVCKCLYALLSRDDVDVYTKNLILAQLNHLADKNYDMVNRDLIYKWMSALRGRLISEVEKEIEFKSMHKPDVLKLMKQLLNAEDVSEKQKEHLKIFMDAVRQDAEKVVNSEHNGKKWVTLCPFVRQIINKLKTKRTQNAVCDIPHVNSSYFKK